MMRTPTLQDHRSPPTRHSPQAVDADDVILEPIASWGELQSLGITSIFEESPTPSVIATPITHRRDLDEKDKEKDKPVHTNCPPMTGKIRNQLSARKSVQEALNDCGDDENLRACVIAATECEEYKAGKAVPAELLSALSEVVGVRSQSKCRFPGCGKLSVRTDRAKEHARVHIGNHPYKCQRIQADGTLGCGATFLRKHDRNRHDNGADILTCDECGASIQGKGREYNLQRHKTNYCPARKQAAQNGAANRNKDTGHMLTQVSNQLLDIPQVHGPVTQSAVLSMTVAEEH